MVRRLTVLVMVVAFVGSACGPRDDSEDTATTEAVATTTEAVATTVIVNTGSEPLGVLYLSSGARYQFPSDKKGDDADNVGLFLGDLEILVVEDASSFPEENTDNPSGGWSPDPIPGFVERWDVGREYDGDGHGCFVSSEFIFVGKYDNKGEALFDNEGNAVGGTHGIEKISSVNDSGYGGSYGSLAEPRNDGKARFVAHSGEFSETVVHVKVAGGVDTLELVVELLMEGIPAAPEYAISYAPRWRYGPGTKPIDPGPEIPDAPGTGYGDVNVIDSFGGSDHPAAEFHGQFISGILWRLGVSATESDVGYPGSNFATELAVASSVVDGVNNISMGGHSCWVTEGTSFENSNGDTITVPDLNDDEDTVDVLVLPPIAIPAVLYGDSDNGVPGIDATIVASAGNDATASNSEMEGRCHLDTFPAAYASFTSEATSVEATSVGGLLSGLPLAVRPYYQGIGDRVWSVGALSGDDTRASFSNCGPETVWAPGVGIISDYDDGTAVWAGTSFAAPIVAAAIASDLVP